MTEEEYEVLRRQALALDTARLEELVAGLNSELNDRYTVAQQERDDEMRRRIEGQYDCYC